MYVGQYLQWYVESKTFGVWVKYTAVVCIYEFNTLYVGLHLQLEKFTVSEMFIAFDMDGLTTSHPIYVPVESPDQINEIFDNIIYNKVRPNQRDIWPNYL